MAPKKRMLDSDGEPMDPWARMSDEPESDPDGDEYSALRLYCDPLPKAKAKAKPKVEDVNEPMDPWAQMVMSEPECDSDGDGPDPWAQMVSIPEDVEFNPWNAVPEEGDQKNIESVESFVSRLWERMDPTARRDLFGDSTARELCEYIEQISQLSMRRIPPEAFPGATSGSIWIWIQTERCPEASLFELCANTFKKTKQEGPGNGNQRWDPISDRIRWHAVMARYIDGQVLRHEMLAAERHDLTVVDPEDIPSPA